jgi:hypothetical protein
MTTPVCRVTSCDHPVTDATPIAEVKHCYCLYHSPRRALCGHVCPPEKNPELGPIPPDACMVCVDLIPAHERLHSGIEVHYGDRL